jgi:hypothetical protein
MNSLRETIEKTETAAKGNSVETLKSVDNKSDENPRVVDKNTVSSDDCDTTGTGVTNADGNSNFDETVKIPEEKQDVGPDVETSLGQHDMAQNDEPSLNQEEVVFEKSDDHVEPNAETHGHEDQSKSDESDGARNQEETDTVDLEVEESPEIPQSKTHGPSIAKRLRSSTGKISPTPSKTPNTRMKSVVVGPKRGWSKVNPKVTSDKHQRKGRRLSQVTLSMRMLKTMCHTSLCLQERSLPVRGLLLVSMLYQLTTFHSITLSMHKDGSMCFKGDWPWRENWDKIY